MPNQLQLPLSCKLIITNTGEGKPAVQIRRTLSDLEQIKLLVQAAIQERPVLIQPCFNDKIQSIASLIDKGIIYFDVETQQYYFTL